MEIGYKFNVKEINKLSKFKNPSILLKKDNIVQNGKYKIYLTKNMFNKLIEKGELKYVFTDKRKEYYIQQGGSLATIFKSLSPHLIKFGKKLLPALAVTGVTTTSSHLINKSLKKKRGGNIRIDLSPSNVKKINNILEKLSNMKLTNYKSINQQNGGSVLSFILPLVGSLIPSLLNTGSGCNKKDNFFLNNKDLYPISNIKINEILKNDKNYIGTFSKDNAPILKNNQSSIVNLADLNDVGTHWIAMKFINNKLFYFDSYGIPFIPDIIKKQYKKIITNIYRIQSIDSIECGKFCIMFIKANIQNESDYIKFLLQFHKNNF